MRVLKYDVGHGMVVHAACQYAPGSVQVWTQERGPDPAPTRPVRVYGTGQPIPLGYGHLGSAVTAGGALVWHVYEVSA